MKLSLEPAFKRSVAYNFTDDAHIEDIFMDHGKKYEFADVTWYPSRHTAVYRYDYRVPLSTSGNGEYDFLGFQPNSIVVSKATRSSGTALLSLLFLIMLSSSTWQKGFSFPLIYGFENMQRNYWRVRVM